MNDTDFLCVGQPGYAPPLPGATPVPVDAPWALTLLALGWDGWRVGVSRRAAEPVSAGLR